MNATLTPPPVAPAPPSGPSGQPAPQGSGSAGRTVSIIAIVAGSLVIVGSVVPAVRGLVVNASRTSDVLTLDDVDGITALKFDAEAADVTIEFADVSRAELSLEDVRGDWRLERDDDTIEVRSDRDLFGWGDWGRWGVWGRPAADERVVLTLPEDLAGLDADLTLNAGELTTDGEFGELDVDMGAGSLDVRGTAETFSLDMSAGAADFSLADVREAEIQVAAGRLTGEFTGSAPDSVSIDVSAGSFELTLPDVAYDVTQEVAAGSIDDSLQHEGGSAHRVDVKVAAGRVSLLPGE